MPTLDQAPANIVDFVAGVVESYHPDLVSTEVRIDVLLAYPTEREAENGIAPLRLHGYDAAAIARVVPYKQRVKGNGDFEITIDGEQWRDLDEDGRTALIDHELMHAQICLRPDKAVKRDAAGRPKLKMRLHDKQIGVFTRVIERHGIKSLDAQHVHDVYATYKQLLFSWGDDQAPPDKRPSTAKILNRTATV